MQKTDPKAYQLWTLTVDDMIHDGVPIQYICDMQRFQLYMEDKKRIESIVITHISFDVDGDHIIANITADITVNNIVHHVFMSVIDQDLINCLVTFGQDPESIVKVHDYFYGK